PDAGRPACREDGLEPAGDVLDGLVPADRREAARALGADALQRMLETVGRVAPDAVIGKGAFAAEGAAGDGVVGIAQHLGDGPPALDHGDAAAVVAVARAGGLYDGSVALLAGHGWSPLPLRQG